MSTIYILQGPWGGGNERDKISEGIPKDTIHSIKNTIAKILGGITFGVSEIQSQGESYSTLGAVFPTIPELSNRTESDIRELLKDTHNTFVLFQQGLDILAKKQSKNEKISIELYIRDISNPKFIETLEQAKDIGLNPYFMTLEILSDDYGVLDLIAIQNLKIARELGFQFSLNDFYINDDEEIKVTHLDKLMRQNLIPSYIKIPQYIYHLIKNKAAKISTGIRNILEILKSKGIQIIMTTIEKNTKQQKTLQQDDLGFFEKSTVEPEDILGLDGRIHIREGLIRFGDGVGVSEGLARLKYMGKTGELMKKIIQASLSDITDNQKRAVNIYVKDLSDRHFSEKIRYLLHGIPKSKRKHLIFEILEERFGVFNNQVLENIRFLQREGFSFAIDDLYLLDNASECMSKEVLESLIEASIYPDYIKIDGRQINGIYKGELSRYEIGYLKEIIGYFSLLPNKPIFILEWIQNTEHAIQMVDLLGRYGVEFLFQGMHIKHGEFGISHMSDM